MICVRNSIRHLLLFIAGGLLVSACSGGGGSGAAPVSSITASLAATTAPPLHDLAADSVFVLLGGSVVTMNASNDLADAIAYSADGNIIAVGTESDVRAQAGTNPIIVQLAGAQVLPGFHDVHIHAIEAGINKDRCLLSEFGSLRTYRREISDCRADQRDSPWFIGAGVSMPDLLDLIARPVEFLDELVPDKPALVLDNLGHGAWANSLALTAVAYDELSGDPPGGLIDRDESGKPNGIVFENAQQALRTAALPPTRDNLEANYRALLDSQEVLHANGITSVSDAGGYWTRGHHQAWLRAEQQGTLRLRASNALYVFPDRDFEQQVSDMGKLLRDKDDSLLRFDQVKIYVDGIISQGTAATLQDYDHPPAIASVANNGFEYFSESALFDYARRFDAMGFGLHLHATGDRGVRLALNAIEAAVVANKSNAGRHRITHLFMVDPADYRRFTQLGVTADVQLAPSVIAPDTIAFYRSLIGERAARIIPAGSLIAAEAPISISSDWDADLLSPLAKLSAILARGRESFTDLNQALRAYTIDSARLLGHEQVTGSLEVGKRADLVIVDQNVFELGAEELKYVQVVATLFDGEPVFDADKLFDQFY